MRLRIPILLLTALALVAAACGDDDSADTTTAAPATAAPTTALADACAVENLNLVTAGTLTVATGDTAFPPWVGDGSDETFDQPESKTGYEGALVYELANEMGFTDDQVTWVRTTFDEGIAPGPKNFDFNLQQYSITPVRDEAVDFSDPYYVTQQTLVSLPGTAVIGATSFADLADTRLGAQIGTTSLDFIEDVIQPSVQASVYETNIDAIQALVAGQIDGIVVDLPTAFFMTSVQIPEQNAEGVIVAKFEAAAEDTLGLLFAEGNPLVDCVNQALATLRDGGRLAALGDEWLSAGGDIVTITE
jgi:polar amino acid transport system substrate-binding protein